MASGTRGFATRAAQCLQHGAEMARTLSADDVAAWDRDGFLIVRGVLTPEQAEEARQIAVVDPVLAAAAKGKPAAAAGTPRHRTISGGMSSTSG